MSVSSTAAKEAHNKLFLRLNEIFSPESSNFYALQRAARPYLHQGIVEQCKNIDALVEKLQQGGHIKIGDYTKLKLMVKNANCDVDEIITIIEDTETEIKDIKDKVKHDAMAGKGTSVDNIDAKSQTRVKQMGMESKCLADTTGNPGITPPGQLKKSRYTIDKGLCFILNFFSKERTGTEEDVKSLESFWKSVRCDVIVENDLAKETVVKKLTESHALLNNSLSKYNYFVCVVLSHGDQDGIKTNGVDEERITLKEIMDVFKNDKMPEFSGKPKIFLVQACRGGDIQAGHTDHSDDEHVDISDLFPAKVPTDADILLACATTPGYKAWRRENVGSWFIQELIKHLHMYHETEHLAEILISVQEKVGLGYETRAGAKQMPCVLTTLTKRFYI